MRDDGWLGHACRRDRGEGGGGPRPGRTCCSIAPPGLLLRLAEQGDAPARDVAVRTLAISERLRGQRTVLAALARRGSTETLSTLAPLGEAEQTVYDAENGNEAALPGRRVRGSGDDPVADDDVNSVFDGTAATHRFLLEVFGRDSIDGEAMELVSSVHFGQGYDNAMWNGVQMIYGDGSGRIFAVGSLVRAIDIIAHELAHGVTDWTAGLVYRSQPGALNESFSDVMGSLVKQHSLGQTVDEADWLIGAGILGSALSGTALRSMSAPGTAFEGDDQPGHMDDYRDLPADADPRNDNGGVHINSGIPNRAFHLAATALGGHAWERAGLIWYTTLTERLRPGSQFVDAATATVQVAAQLYGAGSDEETAVADAWNEVGVGVAVRP